VAHAGSRLPVVLVHGIWNTAGIFNPLKAHLERQGWSVYALSMKPNNGDAPLEVLAEQVVAFVHASLGAQQPFDLIGFSMGGLVSRYYVQRLGGLARVRRLITVSTPHQGTWLGWFSHRRGVRQMQPGSPFLTSLNQDIHKLESITFVSLWTPFDLLILPPWSSDLSGGGRGRWRSLPRKSHRIACGESHKLSIRSHNRMIFDPLGLEAITHHLAKP
jgi:triacylglycerol lipase